MTLELKAVPSAPSKRYSKPSLDLVAVGDQVARELAELRGTTEPRKVGTKGVLTPKPL
jgi:hypothetical protein